LRCARQEEHAQMLTVRIHKIFGHNGTATLAPSDFSY
jgi:hypothetical protein